jgi:hypothetical protein
MSGIHSAFAAVVLATALLLAPAAPTQAGDQASGFDPAVVLPSEEQMPAGFVRQPQYDRELSEPGVTRVIRFYAREDPDTPTPSHATILMVVSWSDSAEGADAEFRDTAASWARMGYTLTPLPASVGEEALQGQQAFFQDTDNPKEGTLVEFREGLATVTVQWTDTPGAAGLDAPLAIAQLIESRLAEVHG